MADLSENSRGGSIIKSVQIANFKGIGAYTEVPLKPVTLLFGSNSAGKSTILHALLYAREILERGNIDPDSTELGGERINLGGFEKFIHGQDPQVGVIELGFTLDVSGISLGEDVLNEAERFLIESAQSKPRFPEDWLSSVNEIRISFHIRWDPDFGAPAVWYIDVEADGKLILEVRRSSGSPREVEISYLDVHHDLLLADSTDDGDSYLSEMGKLLVDAFGERGGYSVSSPEEAANFSGVLQHIPIRETDDVLPDLTKLVSPEIGKGDMYGLLEEHPLAYSILVRGFITGLFCAPLQMIRDELKRLTYLGPLRDMPQRNFLPPKSPNASRWIGGLAAWDVLAAADPNLLDQVNHWLYGQERLNSNYLLEVKKFKQLEIDSPIWFALTMGGIDELASETIDELTGLPTKTKVCLLDTSNNTELEAHDVGVGIAQLLPVIISSLVTRNSMVAIEQPELHIHPAWQVVLGDLFLRQSKENNSSFLIETHSEHLLLRLLKRIRQTANGRLPDGEVEAFVDDVGVLFVGNDGKELDIRELRVDANGRMLDEWPRGFFEESYNETFRD